MHEEVRATVLLADPVHPVFPKVDKVKELVVPDVNAYDWDVVVV